jgi:protein phosphatase
MTSWRFAAASDVGLIRQVNEDSVQVRSRVAIVADGMGGHAAGEVASAIAVRAIEEAFEVEPTTDGLVAAVELANSRIIDDALAHPERAGMGTTVVAVALVDDGGVVVPVVVNVGDSRAYQLRDGALRQLTVDHSVAEEWVRQGRLTPEEAAVHPRRHQLTRVLGLDGGVNVDVFPVDARSGDRILLCSDGLTNELDDTVIAELANEPHHLDDAVAALVRAANTHGGRDNISVVLIELDDVDETPGSNTFAALMATSSAPPPAPPPAAPPADVVPVATPATDVTFAPAPAPAAAVGEVARQAGAEEPFTPTRRRRRRQRWFTWRSAVFLIALGALVYAAAWIVGQYANSSYYLGVYRAPGHVATVGVYQGQPSGVLWYKPKFAKDTGVPFNQLRPYDKVAVFQNSITVPSVQAGVNRAKFLNALYLQTTGSTTTTTTTTTPTSTTTTMTAG